MDKPDNKFNEGDYVRYNSPYQNDPDLQLCGQIKGVWSIAKLKCVTAAHLGASYFDGYEHRYRFHEHGEKHFIHTYEEDRLESITKEEYEKALNKFN